MADKNEEIKLKEVNTKEKVVEIKKKNLSIGRIGSALVGVLVVLATIGYLYASQVLKLSNDDIKTIVMTGEKAHDHAGHDHDEHEGHEH